MNNANYVNYCARNLLSALLVDPTAPVDGYIDQIASALNHYPPSNLAPEYKLLWLLAATIVAVTDPVY